MFIYLPLLTWLATAPLGLTAPALSSRNDDGAYVLIQVSQDQIVTLDSDRTHPYMINEQAHVDWSAEQLAGAGDDRPSQTLTWYLFDPDNAGQIMWMMDCTADVVPDYRQTSTFRITSDASAFHIERSENGVDWAPMDDAAPSRVRCTIGYCRDNSGCRLARP
ncbi:hypothetical protein IAU60_001048 [Kwoniella sp. DSM 27419]